MTDGLKTHAGLLKAIGIPGFIVVFLTSFFTFAASDNQKEEFIDTYFLFKNAMDNPFPFMFVVAVLITTIVIQNVYFTSRIREVKMENKRIGKEKSALFEKLTGTKLESADDN